MKFLHSAFSFLSFPVREKKGINSVFTQFHVFDECCFLFCSFLNNINRFNEICFPYRKSFGNELQTRLKLFTNLIWRCFRGSSHDEASKCTISVCIFESNSMKLGNKAFTQRVLSWEDRRYHKYCLQATDDYIEAYLFRLLSWSRTHWSLRGRH